VTWDRGGPYAIWLVTGSYPNYDFSAADQYIRQSAEGIQILWNVGAVELLEPDDIPEEGLNSKIVAIVERYDGDGVDDMPDLPKPVKYWQVGNECNEMVYPDYQDFVRLVNVGYNSVKYADPDAVVVLSGVGGGLPPSKSPSYQRLYLPAMQAGVQFDVFDYHWYGGAAEGATGTPDYRRWGEVYETVRSDLDAHGYTDVPIWCTEMATYSGAPTGFPYQSEEAHAGDVVRRYIYPLTLGDSGKPLGVKVFWVVGIKEIGPPGSYFANTQFIYDGQGDYGRGDGVRKLAYYTFRLMTEKLGREPVFDGEVTGWPSGCYGYRFLVDSKPVYVVWNDNSTGETVVLSGLSALKVRVTDALTDMEGNVTSWEQWVTNGQITLTLEAVPQAYWIEEVESYKVYLPISMKGY
jgi:hypothetical protein